MQNLDDNFFKQPMFYVEGIPCYYSGEYFYRELDLYKVLNLLEIAKHQGWKNAALAPTNAYVTRYITDNRRSLFLNLVKIEKDANILDLGAGWGTIALQIAKRYPEVTVYAFDKTLEGLLFLNIVKEQEKLRNLRIARCTADILPLVDSSIDLVIMIGVLEWVGTTMESSSPRDAQLKVLKEIKRVLKDHGKLIVGIENRFGYQYFKGKREHSGIFYGSILPRKLVDLYSRIKLKKSFRTYIYSKAEYCKLFTEAGFKKTKFYYTYPDYRFPYVICDEQNVRELFQITHKRGFGKLLGYIPNAILTRVIPSFYIVVEK
jgi:ubiquinone/menaquinone biosynthesis C-methylase UbiE